MENGPLIVKRGTIVGILVEQFGMTLESALQWMKTPNVYFRQWTPDEVLEREGEEPIYQGLEIAYKALLDDMKRNEEQGGASEQ